MKAIVIMVRGLQAAALGCYGNPWLDTPALDSLAADGVVFDWHFADNAEPAGAQRAWRSGRYCLPVGWVERSETHQAPSVGLAALDPPYQLPTERQRDAGEEQADLLAVLRQQGIHTCLIVDAGQSPATADFTDGWDEIQQVTPSAEETLLEASLEAVGATLERLEPRDNWLLWLDLTTLLPPWNVPEEFQEAYFTEEADEDETEEAYDDEEEVEADEPLTPLTEVPIGPIDTEDDYLYLSLQTSYAAAVSYVDTAIGHLLEALGGLDGGDEILLAVSTDVGQNLGEHGVVGPCRAWLHDELIHLPLLLRLPGAAEAGRRVAALTQTVDLAPTLAEWFQAPLPGAHGHSLLPLARGETESIRPYTCTALQVGEAIEYALRTPEWALLVPIQASAEDAERSPQLYVKPDDRSEVNNVRQHHLEFAEQLEGTLRDFVTATCQSGPLRAPSLPETESTARAAEAPPLD